MKIDFVISNSNIIPDLKIFTPNSFKEERGEIWTSYFSESIEKFLPTKLKFRHDKFSISKRRVLRGIHGDSKTWKLVSCVQGSVYQVVVDLREKSKSYLSWQSFSLGEDNHSSVLIPPGCGNAFYVKSEIATYHYKLAYCGNYLDAKDQFTVSWNDERIKIDWPDKNPILSKRDKK
jgi:dTDP-4-dehydrorhamnose 3,5-epimerase